MSNSIGKTRQLVASTSQTRAFSTTVASSSRIIPRPRPVATRPASQINNAIPSDVYELTKSYPRHPLLAFFNTDTRKIKESPDSKQEKEVTIPASLRRSDLSRDGTSRGWLAPELRTKSSLELHQLWYKCLMERNKVHTTMAEVQRTGSKMLVSYNSFNGYYIDKRVRKTMARIKFVLNERRLALLQAREDEESRAVEELDRPLEETEHEGSLFENVQSA